MTLKLKSPLPPNRRAAIAASHNAARRQRTRRYVERCALVGHTVESFGLLIRERN